MFYMLLLYCTDCIFFLPLTFMKAQRSFVVNMYTIESFSFDHITLKDGKEIVLSRQNRQTLKKQYQDFLFQAARKGTI